jgi:uncharacterized small protein (TIGR04563 family)
MTKGKHAIDPNQKYEHSLFWPEDLLVFIQQHATRTDRSMSFMVQLAWKSAYSQIAASDRETLASAIRAYEGKKAKQSLYYPGAMIQQFAEQAARLDSSESFVVQAAVALARGEFEKLPTVDEFPGEE